MQANVGQTLIFNMRECLRNSIDERLCSDEAMIWQQVGAIDEVFSAAEANLERLGLLMSGVREA